MVERSGTKDAESKKRLVGTVLEFLSAPELEKSDEDKRPELPGFFSFAKKHWTNTGAGATEGFFRRYRRLNAEYREAMVREVGNLRTYESIAQSARLSKEFLALLFSACFIATFGLFQNSSATIIGAMIVAPLMMPILGFALGTIWGDMRLLYRSLGTLLVGTLLVLFVSIVLVKILPLVELTAEIQARTKPNLYDVLVAVASGLIGAYCYVNPRISPSIAGVAIAVALMPPLCTVGIGIGMGASDIATGAMLLYLSNLVGIALAASFVFWRLRVHPAMATASEVGVRARRNVMVTAVILMIIAVPLTLFMRDSIVQRRLHADLRAIIEDKLEHPRILSLEINDGAGGSGKVVQAVLILHHGANDDAVEDAKREIFARLEDGEVELIVLRTREWDRANLPAPPPTSVPEGVVDEAPEPERPEPDASVDAPAVAQVDESAAPEKGASKKRRRRR